MQRHLTRGPTQGLNHLRPGPIRTLTLNAEREREEGNSSRAQKSHHLLIAQTLKIPFKKKKKKMAWSHPDISLDELMSLIKGFVDILILASGRQSSGLPATWDADNIKKAIQWGIFFEEVKDPNETLIFIFQNFPISHFTHCWLTICRFLNDYMPLFILVTLWRSLMQLYLIWPPIHCSLR